MSSTRRKNTRPLDRLLAVGLAGIVVAATAVAAAGVAVVGGDAPVAAAAPQLDIVGPSGSVSFGKFVEVLPNGNIVVADPDFSPRFNPQIGAVHLYNGTTLALISTLYGSTAGDQIGSGGIALVGNSNFVVSSPYWANGANSYAGAATFVNGTTGLNGVVGSTNSLVGSVGFDFVSGEPTVVLANGNYLVPSTVWNRPGIGNVGAVTWGSGAVGVSGPVSPTNSLVGGTVGDSVGYSPLGKPALITLTNGNYAVASPRWDNPNGTTPDAGAVTWGNGSAGISGTVGVANSRTGQRANDLTGSGGIVPMADGHYVVVSPNIPFGGAVTWVNGTAASTGSITATNTLSSAMPGFNLGSRGVVALTNGNYVIASVGSVEFRAAGAPNGLAGNSGLIGDSSPFTNIASCPQRIDVGSAGVTALTNGNYIVLSLTECASNFHNQNWQVTWGSGTTGTSGAVGTADTISLKRACTYADDGSFGTPCSEKVVALANGNYVVISADGLAETAVMATWGNGGAATVGLLDGSNSLNPAGGDFTELGAVTPLANGDFLVRQLRRDAGNSHMAGSTVSFQSLYLTGVGPSIGPSYNFPAVGAGIIEEGYPGAPPVNGGSDFALPNGHYVSTFPYWNEARGAVVRGAGVPSGTVTASPFNSLVGSRSPDQIGHNSPGTAVVVFPNSTSAVISSGFDVPGPAPLPGDPDTAIVDAGAVTFVGLGGVVGRLDGGNSVFGGVDGGGASLVVAKHLMPNGSMVVGRPAELRVTVFRTDSSPPVFPMVPPAVVVTAPTGSQGAVVTYPLPSATDENAVLVVCVPPSGSVFAVGLTTVVCTATDGVGQTATTSFTVTVLPPLPVAGGAEFVPLPPARLLDTRPGTTTVDGVSAGVGALVSDQVLQLQVSGRGGVAGDALAVALNVTAVGATTAGYVTVFPCGSERPIASSVNFSAGSTTPNAVIATLGVGGKVCLFVSAGAQLLVDVNGYFPSSASFRSANPARVLDTRTGGSTVDGLQQGGGMVAAGSVTEVQITGRAAVPVGVVGVVVNVTVVQATGAGYVTVFPCGGPPPNASNVNYGVADTVANMVIAKVGVGGTVCVFAERAMNLLLDVTGYFPAGSPYGSLAPQRLADTRPGTTTVDGQMQAIGRRAAGIVTAIQVTGRAGVPPGATAAVLNVTVTDESGAGYVTVFPCGGPPPNASNLNHTDQRTVANATVTKLSADGKVCVFNERPTHLIVDINGYFIG